MVNDFLQDFKGYPLKGDTGVLGRPPQSLVPDHAKAAAGKPSLADTPKYLQDQEKSNIKIINSNNKFIGRFKSQQRNASC